MNGYNELFLSIDDNYKLSEDVYKVGDVILFGDSVGHAAIISKIDENEIYYCGHTSFREDEPLSEHLEQTVHILHMSDTIVR